ncbi:MAG: RraA family protein [Kiritimatiellae bacterium]|nr:RraA family protein [Kiritimatiellia bacterium]
MCKNADMTAPTWNSDEELFALLTGQLYTPVVGDILDAMGRYHQFLPQPVQPLRAPMKIAGRAMPFRYADVDGPQAKPFGLLTEALDDIRPGEVVVAGGGSHRSAYWGELLTATARTRGGVGAVIDGYHRDTPQVLAQNWPVFSWGRYAQDSSVRVAVAAFRCPIELGGVWIEPGDLVFGDMDGVLIIPAAMVTEVIQAALEKARGEKVVLKAIENGMTATEAFRSYGIL